MNVTSLLQIAKKTFVFYIRSLKKRYWLPNVLYIWNYINVLLLMIHKLVILTILFTLCIEFSLIGMCLKSAIRICVKHNFRVILA